MFRRILSILGILALSMSTSFTFVEPVDAAQSGSYDINIWTTTASGEPVYDVCYTLLNYSNLGCDVNRDGAIFFMAIPAGSYTVQPSYPNGSNFTVSAFTIYVDANNRNFYATAYTSGGGSTGSGMADINIWSVNAQTGTPVFDVCYQLHTHAGPWSNVGCDVNGDGAVYFMGVPHGEYVVHASNASNSNHTVDPFLIYVNAYNKDFTASVVPRAPAGSTDVLVLTRDPGTGDSLTDVCFEFVNYSNIGCDENLDGRVSFADMPYGTFTIRQTTWPNGYPQMNDYEVDIFPTPHEGPFTILLAQDREQAPEHHSNFSVVFYEAVSGELVEDTKNCAEFGIRDSGAISNKGCDEDIVDGQVDFMSVEARMQTWSSHHELRLYPACGYLEQNTMFKIVGESTVIFYVELIPSGEFCG